MLQRVQVRVQVAFLEQVYQHPKTTRIAYTVAVMEGTGRYKGSIYVSTLDTLWCSFESREMFLHERQERFVPAALLRRS